jgi:hypothetical protein
MVDVMCGSWRCDGSRQVIGIPGSPFCKGIGEYDHGPVQVEAYWQKKK